MVAPASPTLRGEPKLMGRLNKPAICQVPPMAA